MRGNGDEHDPAPALCRVLCVNFSYLHSPHILPGFFLQSQKRGVVLFSVEEAKEQVNCVPDPDPDIGQHRRRRQ